GWVMTMWAGAYDLEVEFAITDANTGLPIEGVAIEVAVEKDAPFYNHEGEPDQFKLTTNHLGLAQRICKRMMCFGTRSQLGFTDTFDSHLPLDWKCTISAPGYNNIDLHWLGESFEKLRRTEPGKSRVEVPISLHRSTQ
ncbi:MAG TPA: hypothetical protein VE988_12290, partial [Gemmataceae bacterium]|nr:hypothetical protein [Gemmataceae bacterium]